jgi:hypothetical protein
VRIILLEIAKRLGLSRPRCGVGNSALPRKALEACSAEDPPAG